MTDSRIKKRLALAVLLATFGAGGAGSAQATALVVDMDFLFSGSDPAGTYTATFDDTLCGPDCVRLTMSSSGASGEFIDGSGSGKFGWGFNLDPALDATQLAFTFISGNDADNIATGSNDFKADGDGFYDIVFSWDPNTTDRFDNGTTVIYDIKMTGLDALDFNFTSACPQSSCGTGTYRSAAHIQGLAGGLSGWLGDTPPPDEPPPPPPETIPEPGALLLVGSGLLGLWAARRRNRLSACA